MIKSLSIEREEFSQEIAKKVSEDIQKLNASVMEQKKISGEAEEALLDMVKEMISRIKSEIEAEKKDREAAEDSLLALLEETCTKLHLTVGGASPKTKESE